MKGISASASNGMGRINRLLAPNERILLYAAGVMASTLVAIATGYWLLRPPVGDLVQLALQLTATALFSVLIGYGAYRLGWASRMPSLAYALLAGYVLAALLTVVNVWVSARLMFFNQHDLHLGTTLLVFSSGIAIALGFLVSDAIAERLVGLQQLAADLANGHLDSRAQASGHDEVADLARSLNTMAAQLEASRQHQDEVNRMRRELLTWVGHDLRTPLASVRAIVEALADGMVENPATVDRYLNTARRDIRSLSSLIDDLFAMAQIDAGGLQLIQEPNSLADLVSDTIENFTPIAREQDVSIGGSVDPHVDPVMMDVGLVGRALANIVSNAIRHTPSGGTVEVVASRTGETVTICVSDNGEGIAPDTLPHVFESFYQGDRSRRRDGKGAGLGLAIARGIVEAHGGNLRIDSVVGQGTNVTLRL